MFMKRSLNVLLMLLFIPSILMATDFKIVVLPFDKINKEKIPELETLSVGISETLSGALSNINNFIIIDSFRVKKYLLDNSAFNQAVGAGDEKNMDRLRQLAQDKLSSDYIVYGTFYKIGNQISLDAKFINISSGKVLKAASVHGAYPDRIFDLQEDLAKKLTQAINGSVSDSQNKNLDDYINSTNNYSAYQYYIQARIEHLKFNTKDYPRAIELYKKAISKDAKYALAWAGMSEVNSLWGYQMKYAGANYKPKLDQAIIEGQKAVDLGPNIFQSYRALSLAYMNYEQFDKANKVIEKGYSLNGKDPEMLFVKASLVNYDFKDMAKPGTESYKYIMECLKINPELIIARWSYAYSLSVNGKKDESLAEYNRILAINPSHAPSLHNIALIYYDMKDYDKTIEYARRALEVLPDVPQYFYTVGLAYYGSKDWANAEKWLKTAVQKKPDYTDALFTMAGAQYMQGRYREARDSYAGVLKIKPDYPEAEKWKNISEENMKKK